MGTKNEESLIQSEDAKIGFVYGVVLMAIIVSVIRVRQYAAAKGSVRETAFPVLDGLLGWRDEDTIAQINAEVASKQTFGTGVGAKGGA